MINMELLAPGVPFRDLVFKGHQLAPEFLESRYGVRMHGSASATNGRASSTRSITARAPSTTCSSRA